MDAHALQVLEYSGLREVLLRYAGSDLARQVVERLAPSSEPERLALSLKQVDEARRLLDLGRPLPATGLRDVVALVQRGHREGRALEPTELLEILRLTGAARSLAVFLRAEALEAPVLAGLAERFGDHRELAAEIDRVVETPGQVRDEASPRLGALRRQLRLIEDRIRQVMAGITQDERYRAQLRERGWTMRNGRPVLAVKLERKGHVPGILHDKSATGSTVFVEPREVVSLGNELEEARLDESREVSRILLELSRLIYDEEADLLATQQLVAWFDFTAARAAMSADLGLVPVRLADDGVIHLRNARHPLLDVAARDGRLPHPVVPLNLELGRENRMIVVTGPNTGGKTVALKTVGLLQLMFQSGLHLPVGEGTTLPCLGSVLADIGDEQSLSQNLSTFSGHVRNAAEILRRAGPDSLVLLDELGAGTDPGEGAALGQAILEHLRGRRALSVVTTHLGVLKTYGFTHDGVENACVTFDTETLQPTYELLVGQPGNSNALVIAERYGIPAAIVESARGLVRDEQEGTRELVDQLVASRVSAERSRRLSEDLAAESRVHLREAESELTEARAEKDRVRKEAEGEVRRLLEEFSTAARPHLNALANVPKGLLDHVRGLEALVADRLRMTPFAELRESFLRELRKHDKVYVPRLDAVCRVEKVDRSAGRLVVRVGSLPMELALEEISWLTPPTEG